MMKKRRPRGGISRRELLKRSAVAGAGIAVLPSSLVACGGDDASSGGLTILQNAVQGGKNANTANWILDYVIPNFEEQSGMTVEFQQSGAGDEDYTSRISLDFSAGEGADIVGFDFFQLPEFVAADYLQPLSELVGPQVEDWDGWDQIPPAVIEGLGLSEERYGVPLGTDGRVLFFRTDVLAEAGLPEDWQPTSWEEILDAARTIQQRQPDVTPLQINAGVSMGEATTLQGFIPILLGAGGDLYDSDASAWLGDTPELRSALEFYETVYGEELANSQLQLRADGRDRSFEQFSNGEIAILIESDYLWRSVIEPEEGLFPIENRDEVASWAMIPAMEPGAGIRGQDFVSASGGTGNVLSAATGDPEAAWELLAFMNSREALLDFVEREPRITVRQDVNEESEVVAAEPIFTFISEEVLPVTWYRPGFAEYAQVSEAIQQMAQDVATGEADAATAAQNYQAALEEIVGPENVGG